MRKKLLLGIALIMSLSLTACVRDTNAPTIKLKYPELNLKVGDEYEPLKYVEAEDLEGDVRLTIKENTVDMSQIGEYYTIFEARDSGNNIVQATMKVKVDEELTLEEKQAIKLVEQLKKTIKNPDTLIINSIEICKEKVSDNGFPKIVCSYRDGFDVTMSHTYYALDMLDDGTVPYASGGLKEDWYVPVAKRNWSECFDGFVNKFNYYLFKINLDRIKVEIDKL